MCPLIYRFRIVTYCVICHVYIYHVHMLYILHIHVCVCVLKCVFFEKICISEEVILNMNECFGKCLTKTCTATKEAYNP